jgi:hypothetical protein
MTLQPILSEFPYKQYEENFVFFFIGVNSKILIAAILEGGLNGNTFCGW